MSLGLRYISYLFKVYSHYRKDSKMPVEYVKLPLDMLSSAVDVFIRYPDSHLTLTVAHSLQAFNTNVAVGYRVKFEGI